MCNDRCAACTRAVAGSSRGGRSLRKTEAKKARLVRDAAVDPQDRTAEHRRGQYAIFRLKAARNAWYWAVHFRRRGQMHYKRFYDLKHGGSKPALAAALAWRDRRLQRTKILMFREFHVQRRSNNTSGIPGVHLVKSIAQPLGAWQAKIKLPDGRKITKSFSILKFGDRAAFERAAAARDGMLALIDDRPYLRHPTAKRFAARKSSPPPTRSKPQQNRAR